MMNVEVGRVVAARNSAAVMIAMQDAATQGGWNGLRRSSARVGTAWDARRSWVDGARGRAVDIRAFIGSCICGSGSVVCVGRWALIGGRSYISNLLRITRGHGDDG